MSRWHWSLLLIPFLAIGSLVALRREASAAAGPPDGPQIVPGRACFRILLGLKDAEKAQWDGSIKLSPGRVVAIEPWRRGQKDEASGDSWKVGTRPPPLFRSREQRDKPIPVSENGVIVTIDGAPDTAQADVTTANGNFSFKLSDAPFGKTLKALGGQAEVMRIPASYRLAGGPDEEDYPSAAVAKDGTLYVAYTAFTHGPHFARAMKFEEMPPEQVDISNFAEPTGGDRVWIVSLRNGRWSAPRPISPGKEDLYKTAITVDGEGRPWVFWSAQEGGNFDIFACCIDKDTAKKPVRLTTDPGPDINPVAATDAKGRVWVAWMGGRGASFDILASRAEGAAFSREILVSKDPANEWHPAIAASPSGEVAVLWDSYARGDYDVFMAVADASGAFGQARPVAATSNEEVRAAAAYDGGGRLWVAYEEGPEKWGKDFGALEKEGSPLYRGARTARVTCFEGGRELAPAADLAAAIGGPKAAAKGAAAGSRAKGEERAAKGGGSPISHPRLAVDRSGRVWLAYRQSGTKIWCKVGYSWLEYLTCLDGDAWSQPFYVHNSDNILDNRPQLVAMPDGGMWLIGSCDGRQKVSAYAAALDLTKPADGKADPVNNDIFAAAFGSDGPAKAVALAGAGARLPAGATGAEEKAQVARCRETRMSIAGKELRLLRGEFHRHTELSSDGGGDGSLIDMYRYGLDAVAFDWIGNGDHDNNQNREYPWWITQKTVDAHTLVGAFVPMYSYERSVSYPDGHRNPIFAKRGVRTLPRLGRPGSGKDTQTPAHTPDTLLLYRYLRQYDGLTAVHTSATDMGTDWRDNDPEVEPMVEIYQGCRQNYEEPNAPRAPAEDDAIGGWRPAGFVWNAFAKGYRFAFQASSDHSSVHISYCNIWAEDFTREAMLKAMKQRHVFGSTDNIIADVRCGDKMMGDEFTVSAPPKIEARLVGTKPFAQVHVVKDNAYVYTIKPGQQDVRFDWTDMKSEKGTSYYYIRGDQEDGEIVWASPMWITRK